MGTPLAGKGQMGFWVILGSDQVWTSGWGCGFLAAKLKQRRIQDKTSTTCKDAIPSPF